MAQTPTEERRVCVVGAGAAGLAAAHELQRRGHSVVVLERSERVGGKVKTLRLGASTYEMGAAAWMPSPALPTLAREVGLTWKLRHYTPWCEHTPGVDGPGALQDPLRPGRLLRNLPGLTRLITALRAAGHSARLPGLAHWPEPLMAPLSDWLSSRGIRGWPKELMMALACSMTLGYPEDQVPACYALPNILKLLSRPRPLLARTFEAPVGGFEPILQAVAARLDVRTGATIEAIHRERDITVIVGGERHRFDALVLTTPLDHALHLLDASTEETDLFSRIRHLRMRKVLCEVEAPDASCGALIVANTRTRATIGAPIAYLVSDRTESGRRSFYQYVPPDASIAALDAAVLDHVARQGGHARVLADLNFPYETPHLSAEDLRAGALRRIEAIQGQRATFYAGEVMAGAGLSLAIEYARDLIARHFPRLTTGASRAGGA